MISIPEVFTKVKTLIKNNIVKILVVAIVISLGINIGLLIGNIEISQKTEVIDNNYVTTKVDTWAVSQSQAINVTLLNDQFRGIQTIVVTNVDLKNLVAALYTMSSYSFMFRTITPVGDGKYLLAYPEVGQNRVVTKLSNYSLVTNNHNVSVTNKLSSIWKLF